MSYQQPGWSDGALTRVETGDGSTTYRVNGRGVSYRSLHGAWTESRYVFVEGARLAERADRWRILEVGFGLGTNFATTWQRAQEVGATLDYLAYDTKPPPPECAAGRGFEREIVTDALHGALAAGTATVGASGSRLTLVVGDPLRDSALVGCFHAVYHDPFGPAADPGMWTESVFAWERERLDEDGWLVTYSAAGHVRRAMESVGLRVHKRRGPPGKREVVAAQRAKATRDD